MADQTYEDKLEARFKELEDVAAKHSQAKSEVSHLEEFKKSKLAMLMKECESKHSSCAAQEREARCHPEYLELLEGLKAAVEMEAFARHKLKIAELRFEAWRTVMANKRAEMQLR